MDDISKRSCGNGDLESTSNEIYYCGIECCLIDEIVTIRLETMGYSDVV